MSLPSMELLKEIPGYKAILKSVLKTQIQLLIEQLHEQAGEESIILTASLSDGTLSHLGSSMGKGFFEGRDEIKSQFLGYCLKNYHDTEGPQPRSYQQSCPTEMYGQGQSLAKKQRLQPDSRNSLGQGIHDFGEPGTQALSRPSPARRKSLQKKPPLQPPTRSTQSFVSTPLLRNSNISSEESSETSTPLTIVKVEKVGDTQDSNSPVVDTSNDSRNIQQSVSVPSSVSLDPTQTTVSTRLENLQDSNVAGTQQLHELNEQSSIKLEPATEEELELEITGVEMAGGASGMPADWGEGFSGEMSFQSRIAGEDSFDQSGNQFNLNGEELYYNQGETTLGVSELHVSKKQKVFCCSICGKKLCRKYQLERHMKIHTGQRDFICQLCSKPFYRRDSLKLHLWNKHTEQMEQ